MIGSLGSPIRRPGRPGLSAVLTLASVTFASVALTGCAATPAASSSPTQSPVATAPAATPATPAGDAISAETPIDALAAWTICKGLGDAGNQSVHDLTRVYDPENITPIGEGFTVQLIGDIGAQGSTDSWCDVSGTLGDPRATFHLLQAEPAGLAPSPAFAVTAPAAGERTAGSPMDALTAWSLCKGFERGMALELESETGIATNAYNPGFISAADGTFTAYILGSADSTGPTATCTVSGSLGDPVAEYRLPR